MNPWLGLLAWAALIVGAILVAAWLEPTPDTLEEPPPAPEPARDPWAMHNHPGGRTCSGCR